MRSLVGISSHLVHLSNPPLTFVQSYYSESSDVSASFYAVGILHAEPAAHYLGGVLGAARDRFQAPNHLRHFRRPGSSHGGGDDQLGAGVSDEAATASERVPLRTELLHHQKGLQVNFY